MSNLELSGYVQIVVGIVGIVVTLLAAPTFLDGISKIGAGKGLPPEFEGVGGAIRVFAIVAVLLVLIFLVAVGLAVTLSTVTLATGAKHPYFTASLLVAAVLGYAVTITLVAFRQRLWLAAFITSSWLAVFALTGAVAEDLGVLFPISVPFVLGLVGATVMGLAIKARD